MLQCTFKIAQTAAFAILVVFSAVGHSMASNASPASDKASDPKRSHSSGSVVPDRSTGPAQTNRAAAGLSQSTRRAFAVIPGSELPPRPALACQSNEQNYQPVVLSIRQWVGLAGYGYADPAECQSAVE